jgi:undecaprenyl-diphosphatase
MQCLLDFFLFEIDKQVFHYINTVLHANWLDEFMLLMRDQNTWIPLYVFILYRVYKINPAITIPFLILSALTFALTDFTSASIIKPMVARLRPCYDADISGSMYQLVGCGGRYSFPSSHATNHFGLACVWFNMIYFIRRVKWQWVWAWAAIICYAQIYVGKHFPLDIIAGAILGSTIGYLVSRIFIYWHNKTNGTFTLVVKKQSIQPHSV